MSGNDKTPKNPPPKPSTKPPRKPGSEELYEDGDMATPKRDFDEEDLKEQEDKRM